MHKYLVLYMSLKVLSLVQSVCFIVPIFTFLPYPLLHFFAILYVQAVTAAEYIERRNKDMFDKNVCLVCGTPIPENEDYCSNCGAHRPKFKDNYCTNPDCRNFQKLLDDPFQKRCGACGELTVQGKVINDMI